MKLDKQQRKKVIGEIERTLEAACRICPELSSDNKGCKGCKVFSKLRKLGGELGESDRIIECSAHLTAEQRITAAENNISEKAAIARIKRGMWAEDAVTVPLEAQRWTDKDDATVIELRKAGMSLVEISSNMGRSLSGVRSRWHRVIVSKIEKLKEEGKY